MRNSKGLCRFLKFSMHGDSPEEEARQLFEELQRRGGIISHDYEIYKYGRHVYGYQLSIPVALPWEPFYRTLEDSPVAHVAKPVLSE
jgi:hypothetical protein